MPGIGTGRLLSGLRVPPLPLPGRRHARSDNPRPRTRAGPSAQSVVGQEFRRDRLRVRLVDVGLLEQVRQDGGRQLRRHGARGRS